MIADQRRQFGGLEDMVHPAARAGATLQAIWVAKPVPQGDQRTHANGLAQDARGTTTVFKGELRQRGGCRLEVGQARARLERYRPDA